jgi:hypothetical protein
MPIEQIIRIIEETLARFGNGASYEQYRQVAFELFPDVMKAMGESFARSGFTKWLKDGMRRTFNLDEMDPDAPQVQLDLLPGLAAPAYINVGTWQVPQPRKFQDCTLADIDIAIVTRKTVYSRQGARIEDLQQKREWIAAHIRRDDETIIEVCHRIRSIVPLELDDERSTNKQESI